MRSDPIVVAALAALVVAVYSGCISAPEVVLVDRKTLLEEQAGGELVALENELREEVLHAEAAPFTRQHLRNDAGADLSDDTLGTIVSVHALITTDAEVVDDLLRRRCVGEAVSGLLVATPARCAGRTIAARTSAIVQRVNRGRRQLWQYLHEQQPDVSEPALRERWRQHHADTIVCGGQVQRPDLTWQVKACADER
jgi:uncharacterized protein YdbL (DUF1318 family)